jgi:uncharacterized membrane protein YqhA
MPRQSEFEKRKSKKIHPWLLLLEKPSQYLESFFPVFGSATRLILFIAAILSAVGAATVLIVVSQKLLWNDILAPLLSGSLKTEGFNTSVMKLVEGYLLCSIFYITSLGLYGMAVTRQRNWPAWLSGYANLDILKEKLIGLIVTILSIEFLDLILRVMYSFDTELFKTNPLLALLVFSGIGVISSIMIFALVFYIRALNSNSKTQDKNHQIKR